MQDVIWRERPELRAPVMVCAFKGWNDAGEAASAAVGFIEEHFDCASVAEIDPEEFYDFTAVRPTVRMIDGDAREIDWPENTLTAARVPGAESDLLLLQGIEPSLRWRRFTENVVETARAARRAHGADPGRAARRRARTAGRCRSRASLTTRASSIGSASSARATRAHRNRGRAAPRLLGRGPAVGEPVGVRAALRRRGAQPQGGAGARARLRGCAGVAVDAGELETAAEDYERQVSAAVASDPEVKAFVERLESAMDEVEAEATSEDQIPSADTIARDFQRFLRQREARTSP